MSGETATGIGGDRRADQDRVDAWPSIDRKAAEIRRPRFGDAFESERPTTPGEPNVEERPTVSPPFDIEEYAKASEAKVRAAKSDEPLPPAMEEDLLAEQIPRALSRPPRPPQITLTDEAELEQARINSVLMPSEPPRRAASSVPGPTEEASPPTVAYPPEFERDPFARLSEPAPASNDGARLAREMRDRFSFGDYTGALEAAEALLQREPTSDDAAQVAEECRAKLLQMYTARIGPMDCVPVVLVPREQLRWLSINHRAGFLLSHIDGVSSLEMILDVSGIRSSTR